MDGKQFDSLLVLGHSLVTFFELGRSIAEIAIELLVCLILSGSLYDTNHPMLIASLTIDTVAIHENDSWFIEAHVAEHFSKKLIKKWKYFFDFILGFLNDFMG